ncbi:uncharacterized protein MICPUCDRAFT_35527 [Micromonas pusilla CCMP1545]|uniref:Predicted protein n=1 Tax=Micromonas pusilla (strain CCMP1545) TaxID=564608 RepID=C1N2T5_MICPC|nr:uncharacterized protein MICPUCDRAFT_35527 [Micromonas pusilla CCMP1545]EEH53853.1 predicted protein [Micromonas pusilla CCMP1545]|eukprot:XP_003062141.1 predicted protein [Micromonas pusilla CCMP1545]
MSVTLRAKVAILGDRAVGKTAFTQMFHSKGKLFPKNYKLTGGMDVVVAPVPIEGTKAVVELYVCDVSGHEMFSDMMPILLENVNMVILVYDQSSRESFDKCASCLEALKAVPSNKGKAIRGVLVGNKYDLLRRRGVSVEEATRWAESRQLVFMETSALPPGKDIAAPFKWCANAFHESYEARLVQLDNAA